MDAQLDFLDRASMRVKTAPQPSTILRELEEKASDGFLKRAGEFVLHFLAGGPMSSEDLTDACKAAGIVPAEDRHFGVVYATLSRRGQIVKAGVCDRRKGNGTTGGNIWKLA